MKRTKEQAAAANAFLTGAISGLTSCAVLQPFDLLRTRLQETPGSIRQPKILPIVKSIWRHEGMAGFWRGTGIPTISLSTSTY